MVMSDDATKQRSYLVYNNILRLALIRFGLWRFFFGEVDSYVFTLGSCFASESAQLPAA